MLITDIFRPLINAPYSCDELLRPHEPSETKWSWFLWTPPGLQQVLQDANKSLLEIEHELDVRRILSSSMIGMTLTSHRSFHRALHRTF